MGITILQGDITRASVDAIVNAANPMMLGGGGVDGAIHQAAGPDILLSCRKIQSIDGIRCPVGEARITPAGDLSSQYVIHTVGPRYRVDKTPEVLLKSAYQNTLTLALRNNCNSIAIPAMSCGVYGYPPHGAAHIALQTCTDKEYQHLHIVFYLYSERMTGIWQTTLDSMDI